MLKLGKRVGNGMILMPNIRLAIQKDIKEIMEVIQDAKDLLKASGSLQWNLPDNYPHQETIVNDINNQVLYVYDDNDKILGIIAILGHDENYDKIEGKWLSEEKYLSLHRIAVRNNYHHMKISDKLLAFALEYAKDQNISSIKVDTHEKNLPMQKVLERNGYQYCGIIVLKRTATDNLRKAYEKKVI